MLSRFHKGSLPQTALELMRSRYSAYALKDADYIIDTTHPLNPSYSSNKQQWKEDILHFAQNTIFEDLEIHDFEENDNWAYVTFTAYLGQDSQDATFTEKSRFEKINGKWLYLDGVKIT